MLKKAHEVYNGFRFLTLGRNKTEVSLELKAGNVYNPETSFFQFFRKSGYGYNAHAVAVT